LNSSEPSRRRRRGGVGSRSGIERACTKKPLEIDSGAAGSAKNGVMKGRGITGGAGAGPPSVTPFMLHNLTKSLSESTTNKGQSPGYVSKRKDWEMEVERERDRESVRVRRQEQLRYEGAREREKRERERDGVVVCKERSGGVQWKYVRKEGRAGENVMEVLHAKQHRDPVAVSHFCLPRWIGNGGSLN